MPQAAIGQIQEALKMQKTQDVEMEATQTCKLIAYDEK